MNQRIYPLLLLILILASFFRVQAIVLGIAVVIIASAVIQYFAVVKMARLFALLLAPAILGLAVGYKNDTYLIVKDFYYFAIPVLFILAGIMLACKVSVPHFLKTLVFAGVGTTIIVTGISVSYMGLGALTDPYLAHYAVGIVGAPGPPVALACLLLTKKMNIRLFTSRWFAAFVAINTFGIYMFASRTYLIITLCFLLLLVADKVKRVWIFPLMFLTVIAFLAVPLISLTFDSSNTFVNKIMGSFSELSINDYNTEQDINTRYRGYESFMALKGYTEGSIPDWIFGGLGKLIDLKTFVRLGEDSDFQFIPVLHNGWLYILIKTGIIGVLAYISVFFGLIVFNWKRYADKNSRPIIRLFAALTIGCVLSLLLTNYIVTAFFNMEMSILLVTLGYSYVNFHMLSARLKAREQLQQVEYDNMEAA
jgi:hypothetical protein